MIEALIIKGTSLYWGCSKIKQEHWADVWNYCKWDQKDKREILIRLKFNIMISILIWILELMIILLVRIELNPVLTYWAIHLCSNH